jgi:hypothetical protein
MASRARTAVNVALLVVVATLAWLALRPARDTATADTTPVSAAQPTTVTRIAVERPGAPVITLARDDGGWRLATPLAAPADTFRVQTLLALLAAPSRSGFQASGNDLEQFGLDPPKAVLRFDAQVIEVGDTEPVSGRRYLHDPAQDRVHLLEDRWFGQIFGSAAAWVDPRPLPRGARPVRIALPGVVWQRAGAGWRREPPDPALSADAGVALAESWQRARALSVRALDPDVAWDREVRLTLEGAQGALRFAVGEERGAVLLGRRDLGLQYRFLERQGRALLAATPGDGP